MRLRPAPLSTMLRHEMQPTNLHPSQTLKTPGFRQVLCKPPQCLQAFALLLALLVLFRRNAPVHS